MSRLPIWTLTLCLATLVACDSADEPPVTEAAPAATEAAAEDPAATA